MFTDYLKYYNLEEYLLGEVRDNFNKNGCLTPEEFFCIVIWKRNASKTKIKRGIKEINKNIYTITSDIYKTEDRKQKLKILISIPNMGIAIASAILTVLYPKEFSVYDVRVGGQLGIKKEITDCERYFKEFLPNIITTAEKVSGIKNLSLRNADRILWGKSFHDNLKDLIK